MGLRSNFHAEFTFRLQLYDDAFSLQGLVVNSRSIPDDFISRIVPEHFEHGIAHGMVARMHEVAKQVEAVVCIHSHSLIDRE